MNIRFLLFTFFFGVNLAVAQVDVLENNAPSLKWRQINTTNFRIIFPDGFDEQAQRMANTLEHIRLSETKSLKSLPRRLPVILQNQSSISNGFVSYLPRRSEFYTMPSQDYNFLGTNDWLNLLAAHEYRHAVQFQHANRGFNRLFYYVFGPATMVGMAQLAVPQWFWEGDAVVAETALTPSGRGKIPNFSLLMKTNLLEGRTFNYHKQYLRSYKHQIPDHYVLGYHMVNYLRKKTDDPQIWDKITSRAWSVPFVPFAFSNSMKKYSGRYVTQMYKDMAVDLQQTWLKQLEGVQLTTFNSIPVKRTKAYTDYSYPQAYGDKNVVAMKSGIGDIQQFVMLNGKDESKVFIPGFVNDAGMLSLGKSVLVWTEFGFDPRWSVRNYSIIKAYDLDKKKHFIIGDRKERYGSVAISRDDKSVVAIRTDTQYKTSIVVIDVATGAVTKEIPNPDNNFYSMPSWGPDGKSIVVLKTSSAGKSVVVVDVTTGVEDEIIPPSHENIGAPILTDEHVLFNSPASGIDNIYAVGLKSRKRSQVTSSKYGAYNPSVSNDGQRIYYSEQSRDGLRVVSIPFLPSDWMDGSQSPRVDESYLHLVKQEGRAGMFDSIPVQQHPVARYSKIKGLLNPYSWGMFLDNDLSGANIGIASQDLLSTMRVEVGYRFNIAERSSSYRGSVSYQGLFPILDVSALYRDRSVTEDFIDEDITFKWQELNVETGFRIPLVLTRSRYASGITLGDKVGYTKVSNLKNDVDGEGRVIDVPEGYYIYRDYVDNGNLIYNSLTLTAFRALKRSPRDLFSKFAQRLSLDYQKTIGGKLDGSNLALTAVAYFPGLFKHHSTWGYVTYQRTLFSLGDSTNYWFPNQVPIPRGVPVGRSADFYSASANYSLPLWYPDIAIGPFLNIQRFKANLFFDYAHGTTRVPQALDPDGIDVREYASIGLEGKVDFNVFRTLPQFELGIRYTKGLKPSITEFELLIGAINF